MRIRMRRKARRWPVSHIGRVKRFHKNAVIRPEWNEEYGEYMLAVWKSDGSGPAYFLDGWTALYREQPERAKQLLLSNGAQLADLDRLI